MTAPASPPVAPPAPTWAVAATVREAAPVVLAFAAHHLSLGAEEVWLFFDDAEDPAIPLAEALPGVRAVRCDAMHWARVARARPDAAPLRQAANATFAYRHTRAGWLVHLDADEFLWPGAPVAETLAGTGPEASWLQIPNFERVWTGDAPADSIFDGAFRVPLPPREARIDPARTDPARIDPEGTDAPFFHNGLAGHSAGKPLVPTGRALDLYVHAPRLRGTKTIPPHRIAPRLIVLHFDGLTPLHWAAKTLRYASHARDVALIGQQFRHRIRQIEHVRDHCVTLADALAFHARLFRLSAPQARALASGHRLIRPDIDPAGALRRRAPDQAAALTPAAFDVQLARTYEAFLATIPASGPSAS